jgi:hypothetical protein
VNIEAQGSEWLLYSNYPEPKRKVSVEIQHLNDMKKFPKVLGMGDVVRLLGVSRQYVDKLIEQGKLRCQETSTGKVFLEEDVMKFKKKTESQKIPAR